MKYLSFDIEATGLEENCLIIEFAMIPFDTELSKLEEELSFETYVQCPSFEELKKDLNPWVIENNRQLIEKAHKEGISLSELKNKLEVYMDSE